MPDGTGGTLPVRTPRAVVRRARCPSRAHASSVHRQEIRMTKQSNDGHFRVVVDGSNIATEGRSLPSLAQLNDAVTSFVDEHPDAMITVVVDATFGHRIDKS